ncbi:MAG: hypothetical protein KGJ59_14800, partial [Bacteroidota bacterium]|nr:hypothetical protein [Bacteroidota bacterium]
MSFDLLAFGKGVDIIFALASLAVLYRLARLVLRDAVLSLVATLAFAFDAWFLRWAGSAMETSCAVFLTLSVVYSGLTERRNTSAFLCGLLALVRPEGALLFFLLLAASLFPFKKASFDFVLKPILFFCLPVVPWLIFSYFYFGTILPNSFFSKSNGIVSLADGIEGATITGKIILSTQFLAFVGNFLAFWFLVRNRNYETGKAPGLLFVWSVALILYYVIDGVEVVSRYLLIIIPCIIIIGLWGWAEFYKTKPHIRTYFAAFFFFLTFAQSQFVYWVVVKPHTDNFTWGTEHCLKPMAFWLRDNTSESTKVVVPDIGAIGYYSDRVIYDPAGLVTPKVREAFRGFGYDEGMK